MTDRSTSEKAPARRCPQCWQYRAIESFISTKAPRAGKPVLVRWCTVCRSKYGRWTKKTFEEKRELRRERPVTGTGYRVSLTLNSRGRKTGPMPVSRTDRASCPTTCALRENGCYAEYHNERAHWERVSTTGMSWREFCVEIALLPEGTLWRHNEAGDLPGKGDELDAQALEQLVEANRGRRGFTFTHKHRPDRYELLQWANLEGFTVNLSADSLEQADALYQDGDRYLTKAGPVAVVLPKDAPDEGVFTPGGRRVVVCPAQTRAALTCRTCQLCALPFRKAIVGFKAHGQYKDLVTEIVRSKRSAA